MSQPRKGIERRTVRAGRPQLVSQSVLPRSFHQGASCDLRIRSLFDPSTLEDRHPCASKRFQARTLAGHRSDDALCDTFKLSFRTGANALSRYPVSGPPEPEIPRSS